MAPVWDNTGNKVLRPGPVATATGQFASNSLKEPGLTLDGGVRWSWSAHWFGWEEGRDHVCINKQNPFPPLLDKSTKPVMEKVCWLGGTLTRAWRISLDYSFQNPQLANLPCWLAILGVACPQTGHV